MLTFQMPIESKALFSQSNVYIMLPAVHGMGCFGSGQWWKKPIGKIEPFPTLWLLHGGGGGYTDYLYRTGILRYAEKRGLAVVMTDAADSFYSDVPNGAGYYTYLTEELPVILRTYFPLSDKREDNFIAGLSQGGYGAAKIAFNNPDKYAAVALMSTGPEDPVMHAKYSDPEMNKRYDRIFAGGLASVPGSIDDIMGVLKKAKENGTQLPIIYNCCGTEDLIYERYLEFKKFAEEIDLEVTYEEGPGDHEWDFWDRSLKKIVEEWLPVKDKNHVALSY